MMQTTKYDKDASSLRESLNVSSMLIGLYDI
jgi:hypothetical protein